MLDPISKIMAPVPSRIIGILLYFLAVCLVSAQQPIPDAVIPSLELKDGRVFKDVRVVSQSQLTVLIRCAEGAATVNKALLPESVLAQIDSKMLAGIKAKEADTIKTKEAATRGDVDAEVKLGKLYLDGDGVPKSGVNAIKWLTTAAEKGNAEAEFDLGLIYEQGDFAPKNMQLAAKWYRQAAEQGDTAAQNNLGLLYNDGEGVGKDEVEAVKWFRLAADKGDGAAQFNLGMRYEMGEGVAENRVEALAWFRISSDNGNEKGKTESKSLADELGAKMVSVADERSTDIRRAFATRIAGGFPVKQTSTVTASVQVKGKGRRSVERIDLPGRTRTEWSMFFSAETWKFILSREVHRVGEVESKRDEGLLSVSYDDVSKVASFLRKSKDWASSARREDAPDFEKKLGSTFNGVSNEEYEFWWKAGLHRAYLSTPGIGIDEEDIDSILTLLESAKEVAREQLEVADVAAAFAYKLK